ncbi:MAG: phosphotransferase, partial [Woeseiaceae bacterium]|nr:phosphotransferase [Woeseiaceae bacterium]
VAPQIKALRTQVIHGDANPENILVAPSRRSVSGFIDFGDMLRAPLVFDVAIAAAYLRGDAANALDLIVPFVSGFHAALPLTEAELQLLYDLVRARLAATVTLLYWRLGARAHDDPYRQKTLQGEADAGRFLAVLDGLGRPGFEQALRQGL